MTLTSGKHADEVREMWQCRALLSADAQMQRVLLAILACEYPGEFPILLRTVFGNYEVPDIFYKGYAFIDADGRIACKVIERRNGIVWQGYLPVFESENQFIMKMRRLADQLKLSDEDRSSMFKVLQKWITRDDRIGINGEKLAS